MENVEKVDKIHVNYFAFWTSVMYYLDPLLEDTKKSSLLDKPSDLPSC